ncbi:hypothetical protein MRX96_019186 [Rhipicephalus microplus]
MRGRQQQISGVTIRLAAHAVRATPQRRIEEPAVRPLTLTSDGQFWKGRRRWCLYHLHLGLSRQTDGARPPNSPPLSATSPDVMLDGGQWALAAHVAPPSAARRSHLAAGHPSQSLRGFACGRKREAPASAADVFRIQGLPLPAGPLLPSSQAYTMNACSTKKKSYFFTSR